MTPAYWQRLEEIYEKGLALGPEERAALLDRECGDDKALRGELEGMFLAEPSRTGTLRGIVAGAAEATAGSFDLWQGRKIGPYTVQRPLGSGGMGAVFLAVREGEYHKEVAIKTLKFEISDPWSFRRFRQERQILAGLDHPNIARLLDGGNTEQGTPFLVMDYIEGVPITEYARNQRLSANAVIELFRKVCDAVQYAHSRLIVHRDVKPGNILVTPDGTPKLLDFGIAKLLDPAGRTETLTGMILATPEYASPEQVRGEPVSTATDVYALGAVLYELLTGKGAHDFQGQSRADYARVVCEAEIKTPSAMGGRHLRGDLDNIILKAMEKEPARRYRSVEQFSEDLRRYLVGLPIHARTGGFFYRTSKFVRRHRTALAAGVLVVAALSGALVAEQRRRAEAQQRFHDVRMLAGKFIGEFHDEVAKLPGSTKVREMIVATALDYLDRLAKSAGNDPALLGEASTGYFRIASVLGFTGPSLGRTKESVASLDRAIELRERAAAADPVQRISLVELYGAKAKSLALEGEVQGARMFADKALGAAEFVHRDHLQRKRPADDSLLTTLAVSSVAVGDAWADSSRRSLEAYRKAVSYMRELVQRTPQPVNRLRLAQALLRNGSAAHSACEFEETIRSYREAEAVLTGLLKDFPGHPNYRSNVSILYQGLSRLNSSDETANLDHRSEAIDYARRYVALREETVRQDANDAHSRFSLSMALIRLSETLRGSAPEESLQAARRSLEILDSVMNSGTRYELAASRRPRCLRMLSESLLTLNRRREAVAAAREALDGQRALVAKSPHDLDQKRVLVLILTATGNAFSADAQDDAAETHYAEAVSVGEALAASNKEMDFLIPLAGTYEATATHAARKGDRETAGAMLDRSERIWKEWQPSNVYVERRAKQVATLRAEFALR